MRTLDEPPIAADQVMRDLYERAKAAAATDSHIFIWGGPGIGKKTLAREIHALSARRKGPVVELNAPAMLDELVEPVLFGWGTEPAPRPFFRVGPGFLESASGGTVVLTYLGCMSMRSQARLEHALRERKVTRIGEGRSRTIDVRIIATDHQEPRPERDGGQIQDDLFALLTETTLRFPRLSERPNELRALARDLAANLEINGLRSNLKLSADALDYLASRSWPGGIRELRARILGSMRRAEAGVIWARHFE
jgi:two-component system C4-dicarboxylate transport response regulator DctD